MLTLYVITAGVGGGFVLLSAIGGDHEKDFDTDFDFDTDIGVDVDIVPPDRDLAPYPLALAPALTIVDEALA